MVAMDDWSRVSGAVIDRRSELGLTQTDLARAAGVGMRTIQNLEAGKRLQPIIRTKIERALGWEPGEFRRIAEQDQPVSLTPRSLRREIMKNGDLTSEEKEAVIEAIEAALRAEHADPAPGAAGERRRPASLSGPGPAGARRGGVPTLTSR
jgi:DNA-binding XRE family transcriptional regulator